MSKSRVYDDVHTSPEGEFCCGEVHRVCTRRACSQAGAIIANVGVKVNLRNDDCKAEQSTNEKGKHDKLNFQMTNESGFVFGATRFNDSLQ